MIWNSKDKCVSSIQHSIHERIDFFDDEMIFGSDCNLPLAKLDKGCLVCGSHTYVLTSFRNLYRAFYP